VPSAPAQVEAPAPVEPASEIAPAAVAPVEAPVAQAPVAASKAPPLGVEEPKRVETQVVSPGAAAPTLVEAPMAPAIPVSPELIESLAEEESEGEDEEGKGKKKDKKGKGRTLVFDERRGAVVAMRERKPGRVRNAWDPEEEA
jgi:hypothetical protein